MKNNTIKLRQHSLGKKAEKIMIRHLSNEAIVETNICKKKIRRTIPKLGNARSFIDGKSISLEKLKIETSFLIDFHGQHDQQLILNHNSHIDYLDQYCQHQNEIEKLMSLHQELVELREDLKNMKKANEEKKDRLNLLEFQ